MADIFGIDLGTTYSAIATFNKNGMPEIIRDDTAGSATLPSAVFYTEEENKAVIGNAAKEAFAEHPDRVFQFFKRWMCREKEDGYPNYMVDGRALSPVELSAAVLKKIKEYAHDSGYEVENTVITVPAYFTTEQREATKAAGRTVGINVLATVNEPVAAALSYCFGKLQESRKVLVFDLGGGTFDVSLVDMKIDQSNGAMDAQVICTDGSAELGGKDWDDILAGILIDKFKEATGSEEIENDVKLELRQMAESTKQKLTDMEETTVKIKVDGERIKLNVKRDEFDAATAHKLAEAMNMLDSVLKQAADAGYAEDSIDMVLLVGGSTRMNQVRDKLNARFPEKVQIYDPEQAVACGAAIACKYIQDGLVREELEKIIDKLSHGGKIVVREDGTTVIREGGTDIEVPVTGIPVGPEVNIPLTAETTAQELEDAAKKLAPPIDIKIKGVAPSTFGVIVRRGDHHVCKNLIPKGTPTPCDKTEKYGAPGGDHIHLILPVVQSVSEHEEDEVLRPNPEVSVYEFPDTSLQMKQVAMLQMDTVPGLEPGEEVDVTVEFDALENLKVTMYIPATGDRKDCAVKFSAVSAEDEAKIKKNIEDMNIIDDI